MRFIPHLFRYLEKRKKGLIKVRDLFFIIIIFSFFLADLFAAEEASFDLDPIIITKSNIHLASPYSLESDSLKNLPFASWTEALTFTPLDLQSRTIKAGIQTDFSLRGSTYQGVLVLIDGQRVNDPKLGHYNCDLPLTREDIQRIEVIPGAGSSIFGPDAIGGAINIILINPCLPNETAGTLFSASKTAIWRSFGWARINKYKLFL